MNKRAKSNTIRIIAGNWRGRRLPVIDRDGLRPTTDRVRETVFNWLMGDIVGARCLDLFSGSGALGLECLSRGAGFVQFVESDRRAGASILNNLETLSSEPSKYSVNTEDALVFLLRGAAQPFDIVFLDPPFNSELLELSLNALMANSCLADGALVYVEQDSSVNKVVVPSSWKSYREGDAGQARYTLFTV